MTNQTETEIPLHASRLSGRRIAWWLGVILSALATSLATAASSQAQEGDPNAYECSGSIGPGRAEPASEGTAVRYKFSCNGPITGYQLESQIPMVGLRASPLVANYKGEPLAETFSCGGEVPGYALNCVGSANAAHDEISGQFFIGSKLCTERREDPLLTVTYAYLEKEVVTQAISGPFDLGRPVGCRPDANSRWTRLSPNPATLDHKGKHGKKGKKSTKIKNDKGKGKR
jgi:hypothetical protein